MSEHPAAAGSYFEIQTLFLLQKLLLPLYVQSFFILSAEVTRAPAGGSRPHPDGRPLGAGTVPPSAPSAGAARPGRRGELGSRSASAPFEPRRGP